MAVPIIDKDTTENIGDKASKTLRSTVSERGARRMMSMLVETYAEKDRSVVREYIANAVDATVTAGNDAPVEVTSPTCITPNIVVTDKGTGMSFNDLATNFLSFAESTKENSNDTIGNLGIGAKSALMICDSFVVDTVKNGLRNVVRVSKSLDHEVLVENAASESPNGTSVIIPVDYSSVDWSSTIRQVVMFHKQGAVSVDGKEVPSIHDGISWIGPVRIKPLSEKTLRRVIVVSGGTMFDVPESLRSKIVNRAAAKNTDLIIELPVGSFEYTPSREHVISSEITEKAVFAALDEFNSEYETLAAKLRKLAHRNPREAVLKRSIIVGGGMSGHILDLKKDVTFEGVEVLKMKNEATRSRGSVWYVMEGNNACTLNMFESAIIERAVVITDVPHGVKMPSIGRYMDTVPNKVYAVVLRGDTKELVFRTKNGFTRNVVSTGNSPTKDAEYRLKLGKSGVPTITYTDLKNELKTLAALAKENKTARPEITYRVVTVENGKDCDGYGRQLTLTQVNEFLSKNSRRVALMVEENYFSARKLLQDTSTEGAVIVLNKRLPGPVSQRIPSVKFAHIYAAEMISLRLQSFSREDIVAAIVSNPQSFSTTPMMFRFAHSASSHADIEDYREVIHPIVYEMARVWESAAKADANDDHPVHAIRTIIGTSTVREHRVVNDMENKFRQAYPLAGRWTSHDIDEHIVDYILRVPPVLKY
ncbi:MAG: hypothetical protein E6R04_10950 [Spirochaetes bacterium]|nr:MAG: hypothetical protein E6R04_10950 [Spirochaetota bacterium]